MLPGWFDDMAAPVTAVALISKREIVNDVTIHDETDTNGTNDTNDTNYTPDPPPVVESNLTLIFDANGGYFNNDETDNQNQCSQTLK